MLFLVDREAKMQSHKMGEPGSRLAFGDASPYLWPSSSEVLLVAEILG